MNDKVYILLDIVDGKAEQVAQVLQGSPGVVMADAVEGPSDVVIVMKAPNREKLAKLINQALASVETMTEHIHLLPARDRLNRRAFPRISSQNRKSDKRRNSKTRHG